MRLARGIMLTAFALLVYFAAFSLSARAGEIWTDESGEKQVSLDIGFKSSLLLSYGPDDPLLFPERWSGTNLYRLRLSLSTKYNECMNSELAYESRVRLVSEGAVMGAGGGVLPSFAEAPYRISQLDWELAEGGDTFLGRHELDRALVAFHPHWGEITTGRQAIGLGRGVLFGAVDVFAPFSPLEIDREWRRGVDAVRIEYQASDTRSVELMAAFGESWDESALLCRVRGYYGNVDGELIFGKRAEDTMCAATMSTIVGDSEMHLELALFDTPEAQPDGSLFGNEHLVGKAVLGASHTFDFGNGLTLLGEYHYSGFGVSDTSDATSRLMDPVFQKRFLRGDMQILGQQAIALRITYPVNEAWTSSLLILQSPTDGSGVAAPSLTWDLTDNVSIVATSFIPWGTEPSGGQLNSEYGGTPLSLFLQLRAYF